MIQAIVCKVFNRGHPQASFDCILVLSNNCVCDIFTIFRWLLIPVFPLSQKTSPLPIVWLIYYKSTNKDMCQMVNFSCDL